MSLQSMREKQADARRERAHKELVDIEVTTIHWRALQKKFTHDDITAGTPCTVKLANWTEGPATVARVERNKHGIVWKLYVRPLFDSWVRDSDRPWSFTLSSAPAIRLLERIGAAAGLRHADRLFQTSHDFKAFRYGNSNTNAVTWEHRRLLVGFGDARNPNLNDAIVGCRGHLGVFYEGANAYEARMKDNAFYASTEHGISRFLTHHHIGPATRDSKEKLLARVDDRLLSTETDASHP